MAGVERIELAYNNVYLLKSGGARILVDAGPDYAGAWESLSETTGAVPDLVIATHGHHDHAGLGRSWQEAGSRVYVHHDDHHLARAPWLGQDVAFDGMAAFVASSGAPEAIQVEAFANIRRRREQGERAARKTAHPPAQRGGRWPTGLRYRPFDPGGDVVADAAGKAGVTITHCPGHTPGNVVAIVEEEGWLFSGDQLLPDITPTPSIQAAPPGCRAPDWRFRSLPRFLDALMRLEAMPFSRCFPGHGEPFDNVAGTIRANIALIEGRAERLLNVLRGHGPMSLYDLSAAVYPRAARKRFWQIAATVQGHIDLLEEREAVRNIGNRFELR